ncbi:hypothetical protein UPYG_G00332590 [Umbra pygmaea]|uniref:Aurora kinase A and ninein-interacting protein n=1 Tax=Umbra pygmaea TaxID=75934 RepID=A0ABD0VWP7_UMBPY
MKTSKDSSTQEECGVWLDTVDLKVKAKQKRLSKPISKILNPLARSGGYSLAVALNFTQSKIQMPVTKQSSISSFFFRQPNVSPKTNASLEPCRNALDVTSSSSTKCTSTSPRPAGIGSGTKRKRGVDLECSRSQHRGDQPATVLTRSEGQEDGTGIPEVWEAHSFRERAYWERAYIPDLNGDRLFKDESEENSVKRRPSGKVSPPVVTDSDDEEPWGACSSTHCSQALTEPSEQVTWNSISQESEGQGGMTDQELPSGMMWASDSGLAFPGSMQKKGGFGALLGLHGQTSIQRRPVLSSMMSPEVEGKENDTSLSPPSSKRTPLSPVSIYRQRERCIPSPRKHVLEQPAKRVPEQPLSEAEADTLGAMFTQDSEGFRVIAHRALVQRSPLKDRSNLVASGRDRIHTAYHSLKVAEHEEQDMLFTQDSQGNMVIKHL